MLFTDRRDAGQALGRRLSARHLEQPLVLGLPRGGVPVAVEVARALGAPVDVLVVRKLGCPWQPELGLGAVGEEGVCLLNHDLIARTGVSAAELDAVYRAELAELDRRVRRYRGARPARALEGRTVLIVDDGLATGFTAKAGVEVARARGAARVVVAVPVGPRETVRELARVADEVVCLRTPPSFRSIGAWYRDFTQVGDEEVRSLLLSADMQGASSAPHRVPAIARRSTSIPIGDGRALAAELSGPITPLGSVIFAHGSGSSRFSPRNIAVARILNQAGLATLLLDLLTVEEAHERANVFDIELLATRLVVATHWLRHDPQIAGAAVGYFGASTGAAAALRAAADLGDDIAAVVSRGGRPDLAQGCLERVQAPTLLIVGARDGAVLELNRRAQRQLRCPTRLEVVAGATHLFEEPGTLQRAAALAQDWFVAHFAP